MDKVIANCGCVHHAMDGIPCQHDLKLRAAVEGLQKAYIALLQMPDGMVRLRHQSLLCALRDAIAAETHTDVQTVQEAHEAMALELRLAA